MKHQLLTLEELWWANNRTFPFKARRASDPENIIVFVYRIPTSGGWFQANEETTKFLRLRRGSNFISPSKRIWLVE